MTPSRPTLRLVHTNPHHETTPTLGELRLACSICSEDASIERDPVRERDHDRMLFWLTWSALTVLLSVAGVSAALRSLFAGR